MTRRTWTRPLILLLPAVVLCLGVLSAGGPARAEKPNMDAAVLDRLATHVVRGTVKAIYSTRVMSGPYEVTRYVAEVRVERVEKGEGIPGDRPLFVRYWTQDWKGRGPVPPGTTGHRGLPKEGQSLRIYLAQNAYDGFSSENRDGGFNVIGANGFQPLAAGEEDGPTSPTAAFPAVMRGTWKGDLTIVAPHKPPERTTMKVTVEPTATPGRWRFAIHYGGQPVREYALMEKDAAAGAYEIDEGNGIVLPATWLDGELFSSFSSGGNLLTARYRLEDGTLRFDLTQTTPVTRSGDLGTPKLDGHIVQVVQRATLTR